MILNFELVIVFIVINLNFDLYCGNLNCNKGHESRVGLLKVKPFQFEALPVCAYKRGSDGALTSFAICCVFIGSSSFLPPFS